MALTAYLLMQEFAAVAKQARQADDFERIFVYDRAEGLVNNIMHGRPFAEIVTSLRSSFASISTNEGKAESERAIWREVNDLFETFVAIEVPDLALPTAE